MQVGLLDGGKGMGGGRKCDERCFKAIVYSNIGRKATLPRVRATLWVDLRDWEGGRVQSIDTILLLGRYSVLEMANGSKC